MAQMLQRPKASSPTACYLDRPRAFNAAPRASTGSAVEVCNARRNNLKRLNVDIPAGVLTAITGVAGSGKSSLVDEMLVADPSIHLLDQSPLRASVNSTVATYIGVMDGIRRLFASANQTSVGWFSASSKGTCLICKGRGVRITELAFLDSTEIECEACGATGDNDTALSYRLDGQSIAQVLALPAAGAKAILGPLDANIGAALHSLEEMGLGHLTIGRPTPTLSGGERQRVRLAMTLRTGAATLVLDEPTTGPHGLDVERLLALLGRLVDGGTTVIAVEHNLDAMLAADWIIDMRPGAGEDGGEIVYNGPARAIVRAKGSVTGAELRRYVQSPS